MRPRHRDRGLRARRQPALPAAAHPRLERRGHRAPARGAAAARGATRTRFVHRLRSDLSLTGAPTRPAGVRLWPLSGSKRCSFVGVDPELGLARRARPCSPARAGRRRSPSLGPRHLVRAGVGGQLRELARTRRPRPRAGSRRRARSPATRPGRSSPRNVTPRSLGVADQRSRPRSSRAGSRRSPCGRRIAADRGGSSAAATSPIGSFTLLAARSRPA